MDIEMEDNTRPIPTLYEDIYVMLFDYLNLHEKVCLSQTCTTSERVFANYVYRKIPRTLDTELLVKMQEFSDDDMHQFWRHYGPRLEKIKISATGANPIIDFTTAMYNSMQKYCTKLNSLKLSDVRLVKCGKLLNASNLLKIVEVRLSGYGINDNDMEPLTAIKNLKILDLSYSDVTGKHLIRMPQVKRLFLRHCKKVTLKTLISICKAMKKLNFLDIRGRFFQHFDKIVKHCNELEALKYSWVNRCDNIGIPSLKNLKNLTIDLKDWYLIPDSYFNALARHHRDDLQVLKIGLHMNYVRKLSIDAFYSLVNKNKQAGSSARNEDFVFTI